MAFIYLLWYSLLNFKIVLEARTFNLSTLMTRQVLVSYKYAGHDVLTSEKIFSTNLTIDFILDDSSETKNKLCTLIYEQRGSASTEGVHSYTILSFSVYERPLIRAIAIGKKRFRRIS